MQFKLSALLATLAALSASQVVTAGPIAYGICQTGCNAVAVACYAGAGFTFGTVTTGLGIPAAIVTCNAALGMCSSACTVVTLLTPTP